MDRPPRGHGSSRPLIYLLLLPVLIVAFTLAFAGLALWQFARLLWHLLGLLAQAVQAQWRRWNASSPPASLHPAGQGLSVPKPRDGTQSTATSAVGESAAGQY